MWTTAVVPSINNAKSKYAAGLVGFTRILCKFLERSHRRSIIFYLQNIILPSSKYGFHSGSSSWPPWTSPPKLVRTERFHLLYSRTLRNPSKGFSIMCQAQVREISSRPSAEPTVQPSERSFVVILGGTATGPSPTSYGIPPCLDFCLLSLLVNVFPCSFRLSFWCIRRTWPYGVQVNAFTSRLSMNPNNGQWSETYLKASDASARPLVLHRPKLGWKRRQLNEWGHL